MKKMITAIAAVMLLLSMLFLVGCEPVLDTYESDTFELGEDAKPWYETIG